MFSFFQDLKLRTKLIGAFVVVLGLMVIVSAVTLISQERAVAMVDRLIKVDGRVDELSLESRIALLRLFQHEKDYLLRYEEMGFEKARAVHVVGAEEEVASVHARMAEIRRLASQENVSEQTKVIEETLDRFQTAFLKVVELI